MPTIATSPTSATLRAEAHVHSADDVLHALGASRRNGLHEHTAAARLIDHGPNRLADAERRPAWRRFLDQFRDLLILILIAAAVVSFLVSRELKTPLVVLVVVLLNAVLAFVQENRAEASLDALKKMLTTSSRVRRDGEVRNLASDQIVPGDIVLLEAGDRVPADGRFIETVGLEADEAALTGESQPSTKSMVPVAALDAPLGDRSCMAYMNTTITRGRGEMVVTATGMDTEIGRIAGLLRSTETERTPLQKQLDSLAHSLAILAGIVVAAVFAIGLLRGQSLSDLFLTAVALAVASIPEGLPAVTAVTLAVGVSQMAREHAIVKRLASVETLGCTSVICSDKTGTLTLNQMTARELVVGGRRLDVSGEGYAPEGAITPVDGAARSDVGDALLAMVLCNDATVRPHEEAWELVGDPTEGALVVLAAKGGLDATAVRARHPRLAEVPFDSAAKLMATFHDVVLPDGREVVRMYVKGAPDVLIERSTHVLGEGGAVESLAPQAEHLSDHNHRMADRGLRVLAVAQRDLGLDDWQHLRATGGELLELVDGLTLLALVGIVDPPRPAARTAIADAHRAGIAVKMITGDHAATAAAIGRDLGLADDSGRVVAITGSELDRLDDDELDRRIDDIDVFARVAPEHKLRLVAALQRRGNVVAMTGDGVNDAPALKKADMGVAMGITGTEVTKEAATMVLTDDNFATIVAAVRRGRTIYANIVKFVRFQLSTTIGFASLFLFAALFGIADGKPFTAIAILWVNVIMDGPPAMALGVDRGDPGEMRRAPRPLGEPVLTRQRWSAIGLSAAVMAVGTLAVLMLAPGAEPTAGTATIAGTMAFNTFVLFQFFNILNARSDIDTVFRRATLHNRWLWGALAAVLALQVAVTHWGPMQRLFDTTSISAAQWVAAVAVASSVLWAEEARKAIHRLISRPSNRVPAPEEATA